MREASRQMNVTRIAWIAVGIIACVALLRPLFQEGMFFDGLIYASIARNMADGVGTIWRPKFSETLFPLFFEHPPLQIWLEASLFRLFGDTIYVEKFFGLAMAAVEIGLVAAIWRTLAEGNAQAKGLTWLPLILLFTMSRWAWTFSNNMLETTLSVATTLAVLLVCCAYREGTAERTTSRLLFIGLAAVAISSAVLAKGPVGLFPLAVPTIHWLALRRVQFRVAVTDTLLLALVVCALFAALFSTAEALAYAERYMNDQLFASLSGVRGSTGNILKSFSRLMESAAIPLAISAAVLGMARFKFMKSRNQTMTDDFQPQIRQASFALLIAISASLPILVSPRVYVFYFIPSLPFYALASAFFCAPYVDRLRHSTLGRNTSVMLSFAAFSIFAAIVVLSLRMQAKQDEFPLQDVKSVGAALCDNRSDCRQILRVCENVWPHWQLHAYLQRYFGISLSATEGPVSPLLVHADCKDALPPGYQDKNAGVGEYRLLLKK